MLLMQQSSGSVVIKVDGTYNEDGCGPKIDPCGIPLKALKTCVRLGEVFKLD